MKRKLFVLGAVIVLLSSCQKDFECTCYDHSGDINSTDTYKARNFEDAKGSCGTNINYGTTASCSLKEI